MMFSGKLFTITSAVLTIVSAVHAELAKPEEHQLLGHSTTCDKDYDRYEENPPCRVDWPVYNNTCEILMSPAWYFDYAARKESYCIAWTTKCEEDYIGLSTSFWVMLDLDHPKKNQNISFFTCYQGTFGFLGAG